ncbi:MAG TPA: response regulator [Ramlibacter sp.]
MAGHIPVFMVEDSRHMQSALRDLIQSVGNFKVVGAAVGETEATDWLHRNRGEWRLAVLDLLLGEGSGFGLVRRCRAARPDGRIVVFSEYASPAVKDRCRQLGADAAFLKSELKAFVHYIETVAHGAA